MGTFAKYSIAFAAGAVLGGLGTYYYTKNILTQQMDKQMAEEREQIRKIHKEKSDQVAELKEEIAQYKKILEKSGAVTVKSSEDEEDTEEAEEDMTEEEVGYGDYYKRSQVENDIPEETKPVRKNYPYVIDEDQFNGEAPNYAKIELTFYSDEALVMDETDQVLNAPTDVIGKAGYQQLMRCAPGAELYVRDDSTAQDYYITVVEAPYYDPEVDG